MDYTKNGKLSSRVNTQKVALWAALLFLAAVAGMAFLGSGPS